MGGEKSDSVEILHESSNSNNDLSNNESSNIEIDNKEGEGYASSSRWQHFKDSFKRADNVGKDGHGNGDGDADAAGSDNEKTGDNEENLHRELKNRHIQMIALGGAIGTGLLIGSGSALRSGGPASLVISWGIVGTMVFCVVQALGELCVVYPVNGAFSTYASRFVEPSWGFAVGWNYAIMWLFVLPLELVAASMCITYWNDNINPASWVVIFYVFIFMINFLVDVRGFGEAEYYMTIFKIMALVGFIILGIVLVCGGGPTHEFIGGKNWHVGNGALPNGFHGVASTFITASYSMAGTEMVGLASAETKNPAKTLPKAVRQVFWRLFLFFFVSLMFVGLLVPYNHPDLLGKSGSTNSTSPFVIAIKDGGIKALPSIFNACILITVLSTGNSAVYGCSRTIQSLGQQGLAPSLFAYVDRKGRPLVALCVSALFGLLGFLAAYKDQSVVFNWLLSVASLATLFSWGSIAAVHIRFRLAWKAQGRSLDELTFKANTGIIGSIYTLVFLLFVLALQLYIGHVSAEAFFQNFLGAIVVILFYIGHKLYSRSWTMLRPLKEIDLDSGRRHLDIELIRSELAEERERIHQKPWWWRIWNYWC